MEKNPETTLLGRVNQLAQHMHVFATEPEPEREALTDGDMLQQVANLSIDSTAASRRR